MAKWATPKPSSARGRPEAMSAAPTASMTSVEAPPTARICVGTTAGLHSGPNSHGTSSGAVIARTASSGKVQDREQAHHVAAHGDHLVVPATAPAAGRPTWPMTMLIFFWYSTASL